MRDEDIPDINNPKTITAVLEGDKLMKEVLNGGYNVQTHLALGQWIIFSFSFSFTNVLL